MTKESSCSQLISDGAPSASDADIAGIGVVLAFVLSAYLTLSAALIAYVTGLVDNGLLRPVDRLVLRVPARAEKHPKIHITLRKAILALSDQQIVTGNAILVAGFYGLAKGTISVYHFNIVIYLAWMSSSVHLSALTILRPFLWHHRGVLLWRLIGMLTLFLMLMIALYPTVSNYWAVVSIHPGPNPAEPNLEWPPFGRTAMGAPAICFWDSDVGGGVNPDSVLSYVILLVSYLWKAGGLFLPVRSSFERYVRNPIDTLLERILVMFARKYNARGGFLRLWAFRLVLNVYLPVTAILESVASLSAALWLSMLGLIYGTLQVIIPRAWNQYRNSPTLAESESSFGFGQLVPLILLIQPLGAVSEHLWLRDDSEDEKFYNDLGGHSSASATLGAYQDGKHLVGLEDKPFLQFLAIEYPVPSWLERPGMRVQLRARLYASRVFSLLCLSIQLSTATVAIVVLYFDYYTIATVGTLNAYFIAIAVAAWAGALPCITIIFLPFSRLGKYWRRERRTSVLSSQQDRPKP